MGEEMMKESLYGEKKRVRLLAEILKKMDNPVNEVKVIHVSGTNGKGSTCYMINSILCEMGYKVGLFTSPQILTVYELIKVNGTEITKLEFENCKGVLEKVLKESDIYLDINHEDKLVYIYDLVKKHSKPMLAFDNTRLPNLDDSSYESICSHESPEEMVEIIRKYMENQLCKNQSF